MIEPIDSAETTAEIIKMVVTAISFTLCVVAHHGCGGSSHDQAHSHPLHAHDHSAVDHGLRLGGGNLSSIQIDMGRDADGVSSIHPSNEKKGSLRWVCCRIVVKRATVAMQGRANGGQERTRLSQLLHHRECRQLHHASGVAGYRTISKDHLMRPKRKNIPKSVKAAVLARQHWLCAECGGMFRRDNKIEFDHRPAIIMRAVNVEGTDYHPPQNDPEFIQALACRMSSQTDDRPSSWRISNHNDQGQRCSSSRQVPQIGRQEQASQAADYPVSRVSEDEEKVRSAK